MKILERSKIVDINRVKNWDKNPRDIKADDLARLKRQITDLGIYKPILCELVGDTYITLGGNMRLRALKELNQREVWITVISVADDAERAKISLSDNDRAGYYVEELLMEQIRDLDINMDDYKVDIKIPDINLQDILDRNIQPTDKDDVVPETRETDVEVGDMFALGSHRLLCGDSTLQANVERLMGGKKADMVFTDPPYGVKYEQGKYSGIKAKRVFAAIKNDEKQGDELFGFIFDVFSNIKLYLNDGTAIYVWSPTMTPSLMILYGLIQCGFHMQSQIIWVKNQFILGRADYHWRHELCWYGYNNNPHKWFGERNKDTVWPIHKDNHKDYRHPTQKPVELGEMGIVNSTKKDDIVLDVFLGSGSTLIACEKTKRVCYGMELDPVYCQVIIDRWEEFTGKKAEKIEPDK